MKIIQPPNWPKPSGYSNGIAATGKLIFLAGQIGWDENCKLVSNEILGQTKQALLNITTLLQNAGASPEHLVRLTWFVKDKSDYLKNAKEIGVIYREHIGKHYPAMSLVEVSSLLEDGALIEIEATAVLPN